jgi:hypothetical protein
MLSDIRMANVICWKKKLSRQRTTPRFLALLGTTNQNGMTNVVRLTVLLAALSNATGISVPPEVAKSRFTEYKR